MVSFDEPHFNDWNYMYINRNSKRNRKCLICDTYNGILNTKRKINHEEINGMFILCHHLSSNIAFISWNMTQTKRKIKLLVFVMMTLFYTAIRLNVIVIPNRNRVINSLIYGMANNKNAIFFAFSLKNCLKLKVLNGNVECKWIKN